MTISNLTEKAVLAKITITSWRGQVADREITEATAERYGADRESAGRYVKQIIGKDALKRIHAAETLVRKTHRELTLAWDGNGVGLLPTLSIKNYSKKMDDLIEHHRQARHDLVRDYDEYIRIARERLGRMFKSDDYPTAAEIDAKLSVSYVLRPVPDEKHFVADLSQRDMARIRKNLRAEVSEQFKHGIQDLYGRVHKAVHALHDRLLPGEDGEAKVFRDTLLLNLRDVAEAMPALNLAGDAKLTRAANDIQGLLDDVEADELRERHEDFDPDKFHKTLTVAKELDERFSGYFGSAT